MSLSKAGDYRHIDSQRRAIWRSSPIAPEASPQVGLAAWCSPGDGVGATGQPVSARAPAAREVVAVIVGVKLAVDVGVVVLVTVYVALAVGV